MTPLIIGCVLFVTGIATLRRRYRRRTKVDHVRVTVIPLTDGTWMGVAYTSEDSGEPVEK